MNLVKVNTSTTSYPIYFENSFESLLNAFKANNLLDKKVCIVTDTNTYKLYNDEISNLLKKSFNEVYSFKFKAGEQSKNLDTIQSMYDFFLNCHLDRKSIIVALGGGVVGDMAGFAAATYMRGINFVQIPTSLLAQVDSSVGGKVGVDFKGTKNIIGAFYQPSFVYINVSTLKTLSKKEFSAGIAETIKYGMIMNKDFYEYINMNKDKILNMNEEYLKYIIKCACEFKADIVNKDEKENGLRGILNFGHTIGHAIETLLEFKLVHGQCVAVGMVAATYISYKKGNITKQELNDLESILKYFDLPIRINGIDNESIYTQMFLDKKVLNNTLNFVLLNKVGNVFISKDVNKNEISDAIDYILEK